MAMVLVVVADSFVALMLHMMAMQMWRERLKRTRLAAQQPVALEAQWPSAGPVSAPESI